MMMRASGLIRVARRVRFPGVVLATVVPVFIIQLCVAAASEAQTIRFRDYAELTNSVPATSNCCPEVSGQVSARTHASSRLLADTNVLVYARDR